MTITVSLQKVCTSAYLGEWQFGHCLFSWDS